ncbi:MAG: hypothetical protein ACK5XV_00635 [Flavobacteriales bacterium]
MIIRSVRDNARHHEVQTPESPITLVLEQHGQDWHIRYFHNTPWLTPVEARS